MTENNVWMLKDWIAIAALVLAVANAIWAFYQAKVVEPQNKRIALATELSRSHLNEITDEILALISKFNRKIDFTPEERHRFEVFADKMEYAALMANKKRADVNYFAPALTCAIIATAGAAEQHGFDMPSAADGSQILLFAKQNKCTPAGLVGRVNQPSAGGAS